MQLKVIARIRSDFSSKFGIPRQSGLVDELEAAVVFEPGFREPEALRGIEGYSHLWLIWQFSECADKGWSPTVRPPRLGGNVRMGVFASRSPFRPYLPYVDAHPEASGGFALQQKAGTLSVDFPPELLSRLPECKRAAAVAVLAQDPRPAYQEDPDRLYGLEFTGFDIRFTVSGGTLQVRQTEKIK